MKFCFFGYDHSVDIAQRLMDDGHEAVQFFTFPCDKQFTFNTQLHNIAAYHNVSVTEEKVLPEHIKTLVDTGCTLFLSAGYPHKIPHLPQGTYGINVHPSLLPRARGIMPLPYVILEEPQAAGFTLHKLSEDYDCGDILFQHPIPIDERTDIETLSARIALHAPEAVSKVVADLDSYWTSATPQDNTQASTYLEPDEEMRSLLWSDSAATLRHKARAFGHYGLFAHIHNQFGQSQHLAVFNFSTWEEEPKHAPGTLVRSSEREVIIAIQDGYACLKDFSVVA